MGLIIIDEKKCKKDGICVSECPLAIIHQKDKESFPEIVPGGEQVCLLCGHCVKGSAPAGPELFTWGFNPISCFKRLWELPEGHVHHYAMMLGYAKPRYFRLPERKTPKIHWK